jgi:hypothetical protein
MSDEIDSLNETLNTLAASLRSGRQIKLAFDASERIAHLEKVKSAFDAAHPLMTDFMTWQTVKKILQENSYGLSTSECLALGMNLVEAAPLGLKMAGVEFVAKTTLSEIVAESGMLLNRFLTVLNQPFVQAPAELKDAEKLVTEFVSSLESVQGAIEYQAEIQPAKEVVSALTNAKFACAKRELENWQLNRMKTIGNRFNDESTVLMKEVDTHVAIDAAIKTICEIHSCDASVELKDNISVSEAICYFAFGMAREHAERAELENDHHWTLTRSVASAASSLIKYDLGQHRVTTHKGSFFDTLFDMHPTSTSNYFKAWIQAGATSMDRFCRTNSDQFLEDFTKSTLFLR